MTPTQIAIALYVLGFIGMQSMCKRAFKEHSDGVIVFTMLFWPVIIAGGIVTRAVAAVFK